MATVLVTGGAGFIGSHLVRALVREAHTVRVLDNFSTGYMDNLDEVKHRIVLIDGDIRSRDIVRHAVDGVDVIFHEAALPSVPRSMKDPVTTTEVNVNGTLNLLEAARQHKVRRVVIASSSSVYGDSPDPIRREGAVLSPLSPYALSKLITERYGALYSKVFRVETVALRYFNVFGPRQDPASQYSAVIPKFVAALMAGETPVIYGDGEQFGDFSYVDIVVQANLLAARVDGISGRAFNVGCSETLTVNQLYRLIAEQMDVEVPPRYEPSRPGDVKLSRADIALASEHLGYVPTVDVHEGLRRTVAWYRSPEGLRRLPRKESAPRQPIGVHA